MAFRRFVTAYRYTNGDGQDIMVPRGWAGDMDDKDAAAADEAGATVLPEPEKDEAPKRKSSDK